MFTSRLRRFNLLFSIGLALVGVIGVWFGVWSVAKATDDAPVSPLAAPSPAAITGASLHNPGFDNHDWYFFGADRYDPAYPSGPGGSGHPLLPDDDNMHPDPVPLPDDIQDWRLWYMRGKPLIQTWAENIVVHSGESVAIRTHDGDEHLAGLYQVIYNSTPCLFYNFQMYGLSKPDSGSPAATLRVGIDQQGWHPDSDADPAVPGAFPATTVWGTAHDYKYPNFGPVTVTTEVLSRTIVVFSYASTTEGPGHAIVWDSGYFEDVTPDMIHDPDNLPSPGDISNPQDTTGSTASIITWETTNDALGQVYYRLTSTGGTPPDYPNKIYLPLVASGSPAEWSASALNKTPTTNHTATLTNLTPSRTYEYIIVSRGLSGSECTTWVSEILTFTTTP